MSRFRDLIRLRRTRERRLLRERNLFESRTEVWRQVGLGAEVDAAKATRARGRLVVQLIFLIAVLVLFNQRSTLFPGYELEVRIATVVALVAVGVGIARSLGSGMAPLLFKRLDPATAGTIGFLVRLFTVLLVLTVALRIAGVDARTLALGGAFTAVVVGLAAQQTLGNMFAGMVLLSTRPFQVGDRVRLQGGVLAGELEGIVGSLGLFYTTLVRGADRILVPNSTVIQVAVMPRREPERVELRARFEATRTPAEVQEMLDEAISVPLRYPPEIQLEEIDGDEVVLRISATPQSRADGARLAAEVLAAVRRTRGATAFRAGDGAP
jgi:small-conductance mechanosensitive channel